MENAENEDNNELIVVENISDLCRSCLSNVSVSDIFEIQIEELPFSVIFSELLNTTVVYDERAPQKLCKTCVDEIVRFYEFKKKFDQSQKLVDVLRSTINGGRYVTLVNPRTSTIIVKEESCDDDKINLEYLEIRNEGNENVVQQHVDVIKEEVVMESEISRSKSDEVDKSEDTSDVDFFIDNRMLNVQSSELPHIFICEGCDRKFGFVDIKKHVCTVCCICKKDYRQLRRLKVHMNSHTNSRPYVCEFCPKGFNSSTQLGRHRRIHTGEKPHSCKFCGKKFRVSYSCVDHMRRVHLKTEKPTYLCAVCGEIFDNCNQFAGHVQSHKPKTVMNKNIKRDKPDTSRSFLCEICSKVYKTHQGLDVHMLVHGERKFSCSICNKKFTNKTILNGHLKTHNVERNCVCQYCGKGFRYEALLRGHLKIHTGTNYKFKCEVCAKRLPSNHKLQTHMRTHTGEKPFRCTHCGKNFAHPGNLKIHQLVHTSQKTHECEICKEKFYTVKLLKRHKLKLHM